MEYFYGYQEKVIIPLLQVLRLNILLNMTLLLHLKILKNMTMVSLSSELMTILPSFISFLRKEEAHDEFYLRNKSVYYAF